MNAPLRKAKPYIFHGQTTSLCATCRKPVPAKILISGDEVWYEKRCRDHGVQKVLVSSDAAYWKAELSWLKPGDRPLQVQTRTDYGCPFDCGLCPDHEQHSCLAIIEVNEACNLTCPVCFAGSSQASTSHRDLATIGRMMDALVASEGEPDLLQLSGGEPTIHPDILTIIDMAKARPIRHLMINTNGLRIATDPAFVKELEKRFAEMIEAQELLEHAVVYGDYKGIPKSEVRKGLESGMDVVLRVDVQGVETVQRMVPQAVTIFLIASSDEEMVHRLRDRRTEDEGMLAMRIATAREELRRVDSFKYVVVNREDALDETVEQVLAIMTAERCRVDWQPIDL